jgi:NADH-quinone oxidoreductase subunit E
MAFSLDSDRDRELEAILGRYPNPRAAVLPALWLCQEQHGWISPEVIAFVAERLGVTTAVVKGVVTFYTMYFEHPVGEHVIWVCRTLSCDLRGAKTIQEHLEQRLGCRVGETTADGKFTLLKAECLAACGYAPMVQIGDRFHEHLTTDKVDAILAELRGERAAS